MDVPNCPYLPGLQEVDTLEKFVISLQPPADFLKRTRECVGLVVGFLHQMPNYKIKEIVKSGSLGKGTSYKKTADIDLVIFFNDFDNIEELIENKPKILKDITNYLCNGCINIQKRGRPSWIKTLKVEKTTAFHIQIEAELIFNNKPVALSLDILPAIDIISMHRGSIQSVFWEMENKPEQVRQHYSVSFCKRQIELQKQTHIAKVKDLIRLLKYWKNENKLGIRSYFTEVLAMYIFEERLNEQTDFELDEGFLCAMKLLVDIKSLRLSLSAYNKFTTSNWRKKSYPNTSYIPDPVNPYSDISPWNDQDVKKCASKTLVWFHVNEENQVDLLARIKNYLNMFHIADANKPISEIPLVNNNPRITDRKPCLYARKNSYPNASQPDTSKPIVEISPLNNNPRITDKQPSLFSGQNRKNSYSNASQPNASKPIAEISPLNNNPRITDKRPSLFSGQNRKNSYPTTSQPDAYKPIAEISPLNNNPRITDKRPSLFSGQNQKKSYPNASQLNASKPIAEISPLNNNPRITDNPSNLFSGQNRKKSCPNTFHTADASKTKPISETSVLKNKPTITEKKPGLFTRVKRYFLSKFR